MKASAMADEAATKFTDLPEDCICNILQRTSPTDIIRCSAVSKPMQSAAVSDEVWDHFVPPEDHCRRILATVAIPNIAFTPKMKFFSLLRDPVLVDNEKKMIWLEPSTGKLCSMISAMALRIIWGTTPAYWGWESRADSRFRQVAVLKNVCWLEIRGNIDCNGLSIDTKYRVSFMVKMSEGAYGWEIGYPVIVSIKLPDGKELQNRQILDSEGISLISSDLHTKDGWIRLVAGEFTVHADWDAQAVEFSLLELESGWWKSGLIFDGVLLEPLTGIDRE